MSSTTTTGAHSVRWGVRGCAWMCGCVWVCKCVCGMISQNIYWRIESLHQRTLIRILYEFFAFDMKLMEFSTDGCKKNLSILICYDMFEFLVSQICILRNQMYLGGIPNIQKLGFTKYKIIFLNFSIIIHHQSTKKPFNSRQLVVATLKTS